MVCKFTAYCLWLTRELACLFSVADILSLDLHSILLFYLSGTELFSMPSCFFGVVREGMGQSSRI